MLPLDDVHLINFGLTQFQHMFKYSIIKLEHSDVLKVTVYSISIQGNGWQVLKIFTSVFA